MSARLRESHHCGLISYSGSSAFNRDTIELCRVGQAGVAALARVVVLCRSCGFADGRDQCVSCRYQSSMSKFLCRHFAGVPLLAPKLYWLSAVWICVTRPYSPFLDRFKPRLVRRGVVYSWRAQVEAGVGVRASKSRRLSVPG